jgi:hypothetical protein
LEGGVYAVQKLNDLSESVALRKVLKKLVDVCDLNGSLLEWKHWDSIRNPQVLNLRIFEGYIKESIINLGEWTRIADKRMDLG